MVEKLLIVEDEKLFGEAIKALFGQEIRKGKIEIICAYDGEEALNFIQTDTNREIEVVLLDLKMPIGKMDGFTFLRTLHEQNIYIKTIIITAFATPENFRLAVREQVLFFFAKPLQRLYNLKEVVEEALAIPSQFDKNTQKVRFNTLTKVISELSSERKEKLIYTLVEELELPELQRLQKDLPEFMGEKAEKLVKQEALQHSLLDQLRSGELKISDATPFDLSSKLPEGHYIEERFITRKNGDRHGPYYYLRWREDSKLRSRYLGRKDPRKQN